MLLQALNIPKWLEANSHLLQPPINNYCVYHPLESAGYTVMIVGGPNARTDYHINGTPEFFYQYRGSVLLKTVDMATTPHVFHDIPIHEGSLYLLPANTPHCVVRFEDTVGIVMEQPRHENEEDTMLWYCRSCGEIVWMKHFICADLGKDIKAVVDEFRTDKEKRTCANCGMVASTQFSENEVVQPPRFPDTALDGSPILSGKKLTSRAE